MPAKAGIQCLHEKALGPGVRRGDETLRPSPQSFVGFGASP
jgi:hypothetical protein